MCSFFIIICLKQITFLYFNLSCMSIVSILLQVKKAAYKTHLINYRFSGTQRAPPEAHKCLKLNLK